MRTAARGLHRLGMAASSRIRNQCYRALGVRIDGYVWMRRISIPRSWSDIAIEGDAALDDGVVLLASGAPRADKLVVGSRTYINRYTIIDAHQSLRIGRHVMIGPHCYITDADHGTDPGASVQSQPMRHRPVVIEDEAWIGAHATVLPGVRIGKGAVIAAGAVIAHDVAPMAIVAGSPGRLLRFRGEARTG